ncbi:MAG: Major facilitator superfamily [Candidatus Gottesmanbacteria bacterium GW2011_GWA1_34_13]|uniref:Major facilitator superfamily n=1 Tax=Candidatus Gottesmanbacteria bacterium GW2011_GWA1_34_13 TaxID=1618434 RepID=A0A0G0D8T2_9BACT|nr:MAG: Major facilitator superfamily [Candidatus Gottesmanbacteria bacterium GW2011_GWA1_34_13]
MTLVIMFKRIPKNVFLLGLVSFFNDTASEMIYPIVPIFLTTVLGVPVAIVGLIEGIAEGTASIGKFIFGYISDYLQKRKPFVVTGYSFGAISKILIGLSYTWPLVLFARFIDRIGKGLRTAPRDSILLENATPQNKGFIFGFHRAFDSMGAVVGPLLALILLMIFKENMRTVFFIAAIPAVIGVILLIIFVQEKKKEAIEEKREFVKLSWKNISPKLRLFLIINFIFALGNSSDAFILLQAKNLGLTTTLVVLVYVLYNIVQTIFATPIGQLADKIGARRVFAGGLLIFAFVYFLFGINQNPFWLWFIFPIYGLYIAATDGVAKAYISEFITKKESATFFGLQQTLIAIAGFLASFIGGVLWSSINPAATFYYGSMMAIISFIVLFSFKNKYSI